MEPDFSVSVMEATVMIEQDLGNRQRAIGTGFLVSDVAPDGQPRVVLVTARHVFEGMTQPRLQVGFRAKIAQEWTYAPAQVDIRTAQGRPLWTAHPDRDIALIELRVPKEYADRAIPKAYLADDDGGGDSVLPGDEFLALGYPRGLSSDAAGFPIMRTGRLASYPADGAGSPTFLLDFSVFPGNSGGPVLRAPERGRAGSRPAVIAGLLTQQVEVQRERMDIGIVTHARFVRETLGVLDGHPAPRRTARASAIPGAVNALALEWSGP